ncbi:hypothetical protein MTO96_025141 [Rhipicephalus appendiculatus]
MINSEDVDVHFLCARRDFPRSFLNAVDRPVKMLYWCSSWDHYIHEIRSWTLHNQRAIVIVSDVIWNTSLAKAFNFYSEICPRMNWVIITEEEVTDYMATGKTRWKIWTCFAAPRNFSLNLVELNYSKTQEPTGGEVQNSSWVGLSGHNISLGCFVESSTSNGAYRLSHKENILVALGRLNASFRVVEVPWGQIVNYATTRRIDVMFHPLGLDPTRCQRFDFAIHEFRRATFFVQKKWNSEGLILTGPLSWALLLSLSALLTAGIFVLLNLRNGRRPFQGIVQLILALVAAVFLIASPVRNLNDRCTPSRTVIACWLLAGFSLAAYTQSLLKATLSARPTWDADDTAEKLIPKLRNGDIFPCVENRSYFHYLLTATFEEQGEFLDALSYAAKPWARNKHQFMGNFSSCADRTMKGTHSFFTLDQGPCKLSRLLGAAVEGKSSISGIFAGFPIRKYYHLRRPFVSLVGRMFETGWHLRHERFEAFNCTVIQDVPAQKPPTDLVVKMYLSLCASIIGVFLLEVLHYRISSH